MVSRGVRYAVSCAGAQTSSLRLIRCKLAAVALGLSHGYRTVVMIDSDAFLRSGRLSLRIDELVADHVAKRHGEWSFASQRNGGPRTPLWMVCRPPSACPPSAARCPPSAVRRPPGRKLSGFWTPAGSPLQPFFPEGSLEEPKGFRVTGHRR